MMTVTDLAAVTGLGWDTVKNILKARLERDYPWSAESMG